MSLLESRQPNFAFWVLAAWLLATMQLVLQYWPETAFTLNDTDDAMRLTQLRAFLAGQGWFDLHETRVQPPVGYDTHWSRLIDAGLAGLYLLFRPFAEAPLAERLMRAAWPVLWLLPAIVGVAAIAWRVAGREAAVVVLLFAAIGPPAFQQFKPGRIDHHNVQIAIAVLTVAAAAWSDRARWCAAAAGALTGLGLAIGLEGAVFLLLSGAALGARYLVDEAGGRALRGYGVAVAISTAIVFLGTVSTAHWTQSSCDAIAINSAGAVVVGGLGLALVSSCRVGRPLTRLALLGVVASIAALVFAVPEPRCLGGPYALLDPGVKPIWFDHVRETRPLLSLFARDAASGLGLTIFPAAGVIAAVMLISSRSFRGDIGLLLAGTALLFAFAIMLVEIRVFPYAVWFAMPLVAAITPHLFALLRLRSLVPRFVAVLLLAPTVVSAGIVTVAEAAGLSRTESSARLDARACFRSASYAPFAALAPGLIATDIDYGPFVLALTRHSIVAGPYHRMASAIMVTHEIFASPPEEAHRIIRKHHVDYLAFCGAHAPTVLTEAQRPASLWGQLQAGIVADWLVAEPATAGEPFRIYRVRS